MATGVKSKKSSKHLIAHGIGPAVAPGQLAAAGDGSTGLQLALEIESFARIPKEQFAAADPLLQLLRELDVVFKIEVIEAEAAGAVGGTQVGQIAPVVGVQHRLIHLAVESAQLQEAAAGFGWIMEAVVGAGEAFAVGNHQLGPELRGLLEQPAVRPQPWAHRAQLHHQPDVEAKLRLPRQRQAQTVIDQLSKSAPALTYNHDSDSGETRQT